MDIRDNYFVLFGLAIGFPLDNAALAGRYRELQRQYHPDRFAHHPEEQQKAVQWSAQLNTAFETLNSPVKRASYLLELAAHPISLNTSIADTDFLMSQLELREQMDEANSVEQLVGLRLEVEEWLQSLAREFVLDYNDEDWSEAQDTVRKMHFMANFLADIRQHEDKLEDEDYYDED
ncbi:MAG: Fe-S protein assembly co-chaperone HscB [Agitococcus sp.]|nr:Fe-S protein assembly co-chaperone HscB [Moraxellaceae bacterium]MBP9215604.1 Fe-S protein assembly co-chaperone HscB [Agitococcus sp.]MBK7299271.1 Fe-S protein assembly co-chaperone HscB [Moraxellaceae bacterium]MBK8326762.1 Fe-S protein assembly co-chaperone HscB [Moraxellaceae bacterium]MBK9186190.1 Fe-S protein assembly co-chaperone HscB [Moraxellaceae bacterium]